MKIANLREAAMEWTVTIEGPDEFGEIQRAQVQIEKGFGRLASGEIGLSIDDGKRIMSALQEFVVKEELAAYALARRVCKSCERLRPVKDYTSRKIRTVFGTVVVKNPRWMVCQRCFPHYCSLGDHVACGETRAPSMAVQRGTSFDGARLNVAVKTSTRSRNIPCARCAIGENRDLSVSGISFELEGLQRSRPHFKLGSVARREIVTRRHPSSAATATRDAAWKTNRFGKYGKVRHWPFSDV